MARALKPGKSNACPICSRPTIEQYKPFCSSRCADVDLGNWLSESYRIPAKPGLEEEEDAPAYGNSEEKPSDF